MAKNKKVKGFCPLCDDPVVTGGKRIGGKWYHNPCAVAHSYGMPQNPRRHVKPRRSSPPWREMRYRIDEGYNPMEGSLEDLPEPEEMQYLAHAHNTTLATNPYDQKNKFYIWEGPRETAQNIVRLPTYQQANQYYRDVIDSKSGVKNPGSGGGHKVRTVLIVGGVIALGILAYYLYRRRQNQLGKKKLDEMPTSNGTGVAASDGSNFNGMK